VTIHTISRCLEGQHVIELQQMIFIAGASHDFAAVRRCGAVETGVTQSYQGFGDFGLVQAERTDAVERLFEAFAAHRLQKVIQRAGFEGADGVLVVRRHNNDDRQRAIGKALNHFEASQPGHLQIQKYQVGAKLGDARQGLCAIFRFGHDLDIREVRQLVA
jgi:hypothetical protein